MSNRKPSVRASRKISQHLDSRLKMYGISAGAAGVALVALSQPAVAEIVYTRAHFSPPLNGGLQYLDIDGDGIPDFAFLHASGGLSNYHSNRLQFDTLSNGVIATPDGLAAVLSKGAVIGGSVNFVAGSRFMASSVVYGYSYHHKSYGPWSNVSDRYLGVSFSIDGETHYGWVRVSVINKKYPLRAVVTGYAYETIAGKSLRAGATSGNEAEVRNEKSIPSATLQAPTLGMLAAGADGLDLWRRKEDPAV